MTNPFEAFAAANVDKPTKRKMSKQQAKAVAEKKKQDAPLRRAYKKEREEIMRMLEEMPFFRELVQALEKTATEGGLVKVILDRDWGDKDSDFRFECLRYTDEQIMRVRKEQGKDPLDDGSDFTTENTLDKCRKAMDVR